MLLKYWEFICLVYYAIALTQSVRLKGEACVSFISRVLLKQKRIKKKTQQWNFVNSSCRGAEYGFGRCGGDGVKHMQDKASELLHKSNYVTEINGVFNILPLGYRVIEKLKRVINSHLEKLHSQCLHLSILQNKKWWNMSNRSKLYNDEFLYVYKLKRTKNETNGEDIYGGKKKKMDDDGTILSPTCEELSLILMNKMFNDKICLKDLPILIHQFNYKFRNEKRAEKSLFKTKEFLMKDGYSFHATEKCLSEIYEQYKECYGNILKELHLNYHIIKKRKRDKMNALESHEFQISCRDGKLKEIAHIFKLGEYYSNKLDVTFFNKKNERQFLHMGCYGIGVFRLLYFLIDAFYDNDGIKMPEQVAPFTIYLISKNQKGHSSSTKVNSLIQKFSDKPAENTAVISEKKKEPNCSLSTTPSFNIRDTEYVLTLWLYNIFKNNSIDVYYDDTDLHFTKKLKYCDLIGVPNRIIINLSNSEQKIKLPYDFYNFVKEENGVDAINAQHEKLLSNKLYILFKNVMVEYKNRFSNTVQLMSVHELLKHFKIF